MNFVLLACAVHHVSKLRIPTWTETRPIRTLSVVFVRILSALKCIAAVTDKARSAQRLFANVKDARMIDKA